MNLNARQVFTSVDALLPTVAAREPLRHGDSKSGASIERVRIDGTWYVVKTLDLRHDWTMRAMGDLGCKTLQLWRAGILDALPDCINQPIIGVAHDPTLGPGGYGTTLLMRDVGEYMVPEGDAPLTVEQHLRFIEHMATLHARFWDFHDRWDLVPTSTRYFEVSPWTAIVERDLASDAIVPPLVGRGWARLPEVAPKAADVILPLAYDPTPLAAALETTPLTFVHGNWKLGNLGTDTEGRTVVIDWEAPGPGPACGELAWYLSINCRRIPVSKEATIDHFRASLERNGIDTGAWWDKQCALALLGGLVQFGWEKALGEYDDELAWWEDRAVEGAAWLR